MKEKKYLSDDKFSFCLVRALIEGSWIPMGIARSKAGENDFDSAELLSEELKKTGRITCIVPTENWSFVTVDTRAFAIKVTPFTKGAKDVEYIEHQYMNLTHTN